MDLKVKALCVRALDYRENDKLLTLVSLEKGKLAATIRSVKSPKSKLKMCASPLCFGEYIMSAAKNRYTVIGCSIEENFFPIWNDLHRYAASQIVLEVLDKAAYEDNPCREELISALKALGSVCYAETSPYLAAVWFILDILPSAGADITAYDEIPERVQRFFKIASSAGLDGLDALDITGGALFEALTYLNLTVKKVFSCNLNSIDAALKLIGG